MIALWLIFPLVGWVIGSAGGKGRGAFGFVASLFLGPVGWLFAAMAKPSGTVTRKRRSAHDAEVAAAVEAELARRATTDTVTVPPGPGSIVDRIGAELERQARESSGI